MWAFPDDPELPGLREAVHAPTAPGVLGAPSPAVIDVETVRYRPRRRAVLRYRLPGAPPAEGVFAKVLPPARAELALDAARALDAGDSGSLRLAVPSPGAAPGTLLVRPLPGRPLRDLLLSGEPLPDPARVAALPDGLAARTGPQAGLHPSARGRLRPEAVRTAGDLLLRLVPSLDAPVGRVLGAVAQGLQDEAVPDRVVHGDVYESHVLVDDDFSLGLIDLDDVGLGDPLLEAANFSAHLLVLALSAPSAVRGRLLAYRALVRQAFLDRLGAGPAELAWREAFTVLLLAAGPFRLLHRRWPAEVQARVELAERVLEQHGAA